MTQRLRLTGFDLELEKVVDVSSALSGRFFEKNLLRLGY